MLSYILQNWTLILILVAFSIALRYTAFLDAVTIRRMYTLIVGIFLLSIVVYLEFLFVDRGTGREARVILMAIRYSATPFIIAQVICTLIKKQHWALFLPAVVLTAVDVISIFTGVVFRVDASGVFSRGPLGMLPFVVAGLYCFLVLFFLFRRCNRQAMEIIPWTIAENAGIDSIDAIIKLKTAHEKNKKGAYYGIDLETGEAVDMVARNVVEPLRVKVQAINSAAEVANMILRIDDVIAARRSNPVPPQGGAGMPPM